MKDDLDFFDQLEEEMNDDEFTFGSEFDEGEAFRFQDNINEYHSEAEARVSDEFEELLDNATD